MATDVKIAPSVLSADFSKMGEEIIDITKNGADLVHLDVMDGVFVNNITFGIKLIADVRKVTDLPLDAHLMIVEPWKYVERFASAGSDIITVHYEACKERLKETVDLIHSCKKLAGVAINPDTPVDKIREIVPDCDMVLVMSVFPGFGGQKYIESVTEKIREVDEMRKKLGKKIMLEVDGGINEETYKIPVNAGADVLVAGSAVFKAKDRAEIIRKLKS